MANRAFGAVQVGGGTAVLGDGVRVFTCACGKVQAGSLRGLELIPIK